MYCDVLIRYDTSKCVGGHAKSAPRDRPAEGAPDNVIWPADADLARRAREVVAGLQIRWKCNRPRSPAFGSPSVAKSFAGPSDRRKLPHLAEFHFEVNRALMLQIKS